MIRKIAFIIISALFICLVVYGYFYFTKIKRPVSNVLHIIPPQAAFILESRDFHTTYQKLSETSIIWEELQVTDYVKQLNQRLKILDSVYLHNPEIGELLKSQSLFISAHNAGADRFDFLFVFSLPPVMEPAFIDRQLREITGNTVSLSEKQYDDAHITSITGKEGKFSYTVHERTFIGSFSIILVEEAIRKMKAENGLRQNRSFMKVYETAGKDSDFNLYLNYASIPAVLGTFLQESSKAALQPFSQWANWSELDVKTKPNALLLNGFTHSNDTLNNYLNIFKEQDVQQAHMARIIPSATALMLWLGISDIRQFFRDYQSWLDKNNLLFQQQQEIEALNEQCHCDILETAGSWLDQELALLITEPHNNTYHNNVFAVIRTTDSPNVEQAIVAFADSVNAISTLASAEEEQEYTTEEYRDFSIHPFPLDNLFPVLFGQAFSEVDGIYFTRIQQYIVFGNNVQAMKDFINAFLSENTLFKDLNYQSFAENMATESNVLLYSNIARSGMLYSTFLRKSYQTDLKDQAELLRKFQAVAFQISYDRNDLYYNNIFLKYNPVYKQESGSLWELTLDTSVAIRPYLVKNHYTGVKEVFVQDKANQVYLISPTGKLLWKKQLEGSIKSDVHQVDVYKNDKLQMLFNTETHIYLLDRKGNHVEGFPVKLPSKANNSLSLIDYDHNKGYRILISCNNKIYNYDKTGKQVKGWEIKSTAAPVQLKTTHFLLKGKDYLVNIDSLGNVYVLDRKGEDRIALSEKLPISRHNSFYIEPGKDIHHSAIVATDSAGHLMKLYFNNTLELTKIKDFSPDHYFDYKKIHHLEDKMPAYIYTDSNKLSVFSPDQSLLFEHDFGSMLTNPPQHFQFPDKTARIGISSTAGKQIYLFNDAGSIENGFPLSGSVPFSIGDMNNDDYLNLVTGSGSSIYAYTIQ